MEYTQLLRSQLARQRDVYEQRLAARAGGVVDAAAEARVADLRAEVRALERRAARDRKRLEATESDLVFLEEVSGALASDADAREADARNAEAELVKAKSDADRLARALEAKLDVAMSFAGVLGFDGRVDAAARRRREADMFAIRAGGGSRPATTWRRRPLPWRPWPNLLNAWRRASCSRLWPRPRPTRLKRGGGTSRSRPRSAFQSHHHQRIRRTTRCIPSMLCSNGHSVNFAEWLRRATPSTPSSRHAVSGVASTARSRPTSGFVAGPRRRVPRRRRDASTAAAAPDQDSAGRTRRPRADYFSRL